MIMDINWRAVLTGFATAFVLGLLIVWLVPLTQLTTLVYAIPGLMGGVVAGYMVVGAGRGAIHGGLATIIGSAVLLIVWAIFGVLFAGLFPAIVGFSFGLFILLLAAIPGALAGAVGGWVKDRRTTTREPARAEVR
jgi:hypothetical protein